MNDWVICLGTRNYSTLYKLTAPPEVRTTKSKNKLHSLSPRSAPHVVDCCPTFGCLFHQHCQMISHHHHHHHRSPLQRNHQWQVPFPTTTIVPPLLVLQNVPHSPRTQPSHRLSTWLVPPVIPLIRQFYASHRRCHCRVSLSRCVWWRYKR